MRTATLGDFVKHERERRGWTQARLAEAVGIKAAYVSQIESGKTQLPGADLRRRLATALGVRPVDLLVAAGELLPEEVPTPGVAEMPAIYDTTDPNDPRARLLDAIHNPDMPVEALNTMLAVVEQWDHYVKSRVVHREEVATIPDNRPLGFYPETPGGLRQW